MSGCWNNRAEGNTGEEAGALAGAGEIITTRARDWWFYPGCTPLLICVFFFEKRKKNCSISLLSRRVLLKCARSPLSFCLLPSFPLSLYLSPPLSLSAALTDAAHTTEASRGLPPRGVPPAGEALKPERRWRHGSGCKERQGGQWRAPLSPPSSASMRAGTERVEGRGCG